MAGKTRTSGDRLASDLAELALSCADSASLHRQLLDWLGREVGFDLASFHGTLDGTQSMQAIGYDAASAGPRLNAYMAELEPMELAAVSCGRPMVDTDLIPARRRDRLGLYREQLRPNGVSVFVTAAWGGPTGGAGFHLARTGRAARFQSKEVELLTLLLPTIRLGDAYAKSLDRERLGRSEWALEAWSDSIGLSASERKVAALVARGLTNREVAELLGVSMLTARNHLGAVFRKANVSNRAELAFLCGREVHPPELSDRAGVAWMKHLGDQSLLESRR